MKAKDSAGKIILALGYCPPKGGGSAVVDSLCTVDPFVREDLVFCPCL